MSDDLSGKLQDASKAFLTGKYSDSRKILKGCPEEDPKVKHNLAMVDYVQLGGDHNEVVETLSLGSLATGGCAGDQKSETCGYEGNEIAGYNKAVVLLHCGMAEQAATILEALAAKAVLLAPALQLRVAFLLQVATMPTGKSKHRSKTQENLINEIICNKVNAEEMVKDATLSGMMEVSLSDGSSLHEWYKGGNNKSQADAAIYFNNLGVNAMNDGKANIASLYFARAAKEVTDAGADIAFTHCVMYNSGICSLTLGNDQAALECFKHCQQSMKGSPLLWVRVAQACVGLYTTSADEEGAKSFSEIHKGVSEAVLASGKTSSGAMFFPHLPQPEHLYPTKLSTAQSELLNNALKAIVSALCLLPTVADVKAKVISTSSQAGQILQYAHIFGAFINLSRSDYGAAHTHCTQLLSMHNAKDSPLNPDVHTAALSYAAEALCHLNRPELALKTLQSSSLGELVSGSDRGSPQQKAAVEGIFVNLCIVHILNGSWKQAQNVATSIVSKFARTPASTNTTAAKAAALLEVYMELALGNHEKALEMLGNRPAAFA